MPCRMPSSIRKGRLIGPASYDLQNWAPKALDQRHFFPLCELGANFKFPYRVNANLVETPTSQGVSFEIHRLSPSVTIYFSSMVFVRLNSLGAFVVGAPLKDVAGSDWISGFGKEKVRNFCRGNLKVLAAERADVDLTLLQSTSFSSPSPLLHPHNRSSPPLLRSRGNE